MFPLQGGGFGGIGLFPMGLVVLVIALVFAYWVYTDAEKRGKDNALLWAAAVGILTLLTLIGGVLALLFYLWKR